MASVSWKLKGKYLKNCNCDFGCPCDCWSKPTHAQCIGMMAMQVDEGHFGETSMKDVKFAATYH